MDRNNPILADYNCDIDIDNLNIAGNRRFTVTHNKGDKRLFRVDENGGIQLWSSDESDKDIDLLTVGVTGTPKLWWDESEDQFALTKALHINIAASTTALKTTGDITMVTGNLYMQHGESSSSPLFQMTNTNGNIAGCEIRLKKEGGSPTAADEIGRISGYQQNTGLTSKQVANIRFTSVGVTPSHENGSVNIGAIVDGTLQTILTCQGEGSNNIGIYLNGQALGGKTVIKGDTDESLFYLDATNNVVNIGTSTNLGTKLSIYGSIKLKELDSAIAATAGYGQIMVKNTTPCELWFIDDTNAGFQLATPLTASVGTENYVAKWNNVAGTTIGNSLLYDSGSGVVIGMTTAASLFELYSASASPVLTITGAHATDYDPQIQFRTDASPTVKWAVGVDSGDSDYFKISWNTEIADSGHFVLHKVLFSGSYYTALSLGTKTAPTTSRQMQIYAGIAGQTAGVQLLNPSCLSNGAVFGMDSTLSAYMANNENAPFYVTTNGAIRMLVQPSHNIGIGPWAIGDTMYDMLNIYAATGNASIRLFTSTTGRLSSDGFQIRLDATTDDAYITNREAGDLWLRSLGGNVIFATSAASATRLTIADASITSTVNNLFSADSLYTKWGASQNCGITYDGTNMVVNSKLVGTGVFLHDTDSKSCWRDTALGVYSQADTYLDIFADGAVRIGDSSADAPTNYVSINATGNMSFAGSAGFYPRTLNQADEPAAGTGATELDTGEICIWTDTDDSKCYMCYNHGGTVKTVELI